MNDLLSVIYPYPRTRPYFGADDQILYRLSDGKTHYLARMRRDGSGRSKWPCVRSVTCPRRRDLTGVRWLEACHGQICKDGRPVEWSPGERGLNPNAA
jgi:hypothetical protein